ncbi:MAG: protein kinase [Proteobacteria bacterium]|nr:protein kinase [Pseudomonadota bacterium]
MGLTQPPRSDGPGEPADPIDEFADPLDRLLNDMQRDECRPCSPGTHRDTGPNSAEQEVLAITKTEQSASQDEGQTQPAQAQTTQGRRPSKYIIEAGTLVSHYEVIRPLGRGGHGQVYLARDTQLGRVVALKFLLIASSQRLDRFMAEARVTAQFGHENVVTLHEIGMYHHYPYMVLEYVAGRSLHEWLGERIMRMAEQRKYGVAETQRHSDASNANRVTGVSPLLAAELMFPVVQALIHSHEMGIVHRDLKPANIMLTDAGTVKVLDFGVAKLLDSNHPRESPSIGSPLSDPRLTQTGDLVGTLMYMSPEQWGADAVDARTDLWAVGLILYKLLCGQHPLHPLSKDKLLTVGDLSVPMPRLRDQRPELGPLAAIIDRCLLKSKQARIGSARELAAALGQLLHPQRRPDVSGTEPSPYPGLYAFQESDADRFFGRDRVVARMVRLLAERPILAIVGPSGAGKSSFVRAGLIPALKRSGESWTAHIMRPGPRPVAALAELLSNQAYGATSDASTLQDGLGTQARTGLRTGDRDAIEAQLRVEPGLLGVLWRTRARRRLERMVLFIDQFEELYTMASSDDCAAVLACLGGVADDVGSPLRVVISMRSDFLDRLAIDTNAVSDRISSGITMLPPMNRDDMREALVRPLEVTGYRFESNALVDEMLDELDHATGALPLLQFAASRLWETRTHERHILSEDGYRRLGGIAGTLAQHADSVVTAMATSDGELTRAIMLRLITPERTRALVTMGELRTAVGASVDAVERVLARLIDARLLTSHGSGAVDSMVEIVHESLIEQWPTLARWLDDNEEDSAFLARLRPAAAEWDKSGRLGGFLWTGEAADEARYWCEHRRGEARGLGRRDEAFLDAVIALAERSRKRRRQVIVAAFASLLAIAMVVSYLAVRAYREAAQVRAHKAVIEQREAQAQAEARRARNATRMAKAYEHLSDPTTVLALLREVEPPQLPTGWSELAWQTLHDSVARVVLTHEQPLYEARFDPSGTRVVTADADGTVRVWKADGTGAPVVLRGHTNSVYCAAFSPDGRRIVTASADATARVWNADGTGEPTVLTGHRRGILSAMFSPDGRRVVTASRDETARIWRVADGSELATLRGHTDDVYSAAFGPDGRRVITASGDTTARLWNTDGTREPVILRGHTDRVLWAAFGPAGRRVVTASRDRTARVWNADKSGVPVVLRGHTDEVRSAAFSPDGQRVITGSVDKTARVWRTDGSGRAVLLRGHRERVLSASFSPDGERVITASYDGTARLWRFDMADRTRVFPIDSEWVYTAVVSPDGARVASAGDDGTVRLFDINGAGDSQNMAPHQRAVRDVAFSPNGQRLASASWDNTARVWRTDGVGAPVVLTHGAPVVGVTFTSDNDYVVTACLDKNLWVWRADGLGEPRVLSGHNAGVWSVSASPIGDRVVSTSFDGTVRVWHTGSDRTLVEFSGHRGTVWSAAFSPNGKRVVSASEDRTIQVWNADGTGTPLVLEGHREPVYRVAFSPDGTRIVSASLDKTVRVWNADGTGTPLVFRGHTDAVNGVAFSPDGNQIVSASKDGTVRVWSDLHPVALDDPRLWTATSYCMPIARRTSLLDIGEERARQNHKRCLRQVAERY